MPNVTITPNEENCIIKTQSFTKTIDDVANIITVNQVWETGSWTGDITTTEQNAIQAASDAWDPNHVAQEDAADEVPTGFKAHLYPSLEATLTNKLNDTVMRDDNVTDELLDQVRSAYADTGVAGLENAGWTSTTEDVYDVGVNCAVSIFVNP